jgi:hypothetical protein
MKFCRLSIICMYLDDTFVTLGHNSEHCSFFFVGSNQGIFRRRERWPICYSRRSIPLSWNASGSWHHHSTSTRYEEVSAHKFPSVRNSCMILHLTFSNRNGKFHELQIVWCFVREKWFRVPFFPSRTAMVVSLDYEKHSLLGCIVMISVRSFIDVLEEHTTIFLKTLIFIVSYENLKFHTTELVWFLWFYIMQFYSHTCWNTVNIPIYIQL